MGKVKQTKGVGESTQEETSSTSNSTTLSLENQGKAEVEGDPSGIHESPIHEESKLTDPVLKPLDPHEFERGKNLKTANEKKGQLLPITPIPDDAPAFDKQTTDYHNGVFGGFPSYVFDYTRADGSLVMKIVRWDIPQKNGTTEKEIRPYLYGQDKKGNKRWVSQGLQDSIPLYNLPAFARKEILLFKKEPDIIFCEGEKAVHAAQILFPDCHATTTAFGAQAPHKTDFSPLRGRNIIIAPDCGKAGEDYAEKVFSWCQKARAKSIRRFDMERLSTLVIEDGQMISRLEQYRRQTAQDSPTTNLEALADSPVSEEAYDQMISLMRLQNEQEKEEEKKISELTSLQDGYDFADALKEGWTPELMTRERESFLEIYVERDAQFFGENKFKLTARGVFEYVEATKDKHAYWINISSYLAVSHQVRDHKNNLWSKLLEFYDHDSVRKEFVMPAEMLAGEGRDLRETLMRMGLRIHHYKKNSLTEYINICNPKKRARSVAKIGWAAPNVYILPDKIYGDSEEKYVAQLKPCHTPDLEIKGTMEDWQTKVVPLIAGNHRLILGILFAFAPPFLAPMGMDNFGSHLHGMSSTGKTSYMYVANSVVGYKEIKEWRATDNGIESWGVAANDFLLIIDEFGQIDPDAADKAIYLLGNGSCKARATQGGEGKAVETFRTLWLSTGETTSEGKLNEAGKETTAGQSVRFIELASDAGAGMGVFEDLHGIATADQFSDTLRHVCTQFKGAAFDAFLEWLVQQDMNKLVQGISELMKKWKDENIRILASHPDGQVKRVAHDFSFLAAVGEVIIGVGLLPLTPGSAIQACNKGFKDWIDKRGGIESQEITKTIDRLRNLIQQDGGSRFDSPEAEDEDESVYRPKLIKQAGVTKIKKDKNGDDYLDYCFFLSVFKKEILKGSDENVIIPALMAKGILVPDTSGNPTISTRVNGMKRQRLYHVHVEALER